MKIISFSNLKDIINSGDVISIAALSSGNLPTEILKAIVEQHDNFNTPQDLTIMLTNDISDYRGIVMI